MSEDTPLSEASVIDLMRFNAVLRMDIARQLGYEGGAEGIPRFLKNLDWTDHGVQENAVRAYVSRVAAIAHDEMIPESPPITISWGSPRTYTNKWEEAYEKQDKNGNILPPDAEGPHVKIVELAPYTEDPTQHDKIVRPQLRIMVIGEKDDDYGHPDTSEEHYVLTYTPAKYENPPSEQTKAFLNRIAEIIHADLHMGVDAPAPHAVKNPGPVILDASSSDDIKLHSDGTVTTSEPFLNDPATKEVRLIGSNMYDGEGICLDLKLHCDTMHQSLSDILKSSEASRAHIPGWAKQVRSTVSTGGNTPGGIGGP